MDVLLRLDMRCNQRCFFCNVEDCPSLTTSQALSFLDNISSRVSQVSITGGEPTLRDDLFKIIRYASNLESIDTVAIQTNATRCYYEEYVKGLKSSSLDLAFVALHSSDPKISNFLTRSRLWDKTVDGIKNLLNYEIDVVLNPVINAYNYRGLLDYVKFVSKNFESIKHISFSFVQPVGRAWKNKHVVPRYSEVYPFLKPALDYCSENNIKFFNPYCGFPLCYFKGYEKQSNEFFDYNVKNKLEVDAVNRVKEQKIKSKRCRQCVYDKRCNGVWINYSKIHGLSELRPVK